MQKLVAILECASLALAVAFVISCTIYGLDSLVDAAIKKSMRKKVERRMISEYEENWDDFRHWMVMRRTQNLKRAEEARPNGIVDRPNDDLRVELKRRKQSVDELFEICRESMDNAVDGQTKAYWQGKVSARSEELDWLRRVLKDG